MKLFHNTEPKYTFKKSIAKNKENKWKKKPKQNSPKLPVSVYWYKVVPYLFTYWELIYKLWLIRQNTHNFW